MKNSATRSGDFLAGVAVLAALVLVAPARDLCGWTGQFDVGVFFLLAMVGIVEMEGLAGAGAQGVAAGLKKIAAGLPLGLAALTGLLAIGSFNLRAISLAQAGGFSRWFVFHDPFSATALAIALIAVQGIFGRAPVAETDDVAAPRWVNGVGTFVICALLTSVFLGAWYDPFGIVAHFEGMSLAAARGRHLGFAVLANGLGAAVFFAKAAGLTWVERFFGRHLPRYRMGEVVGLCVDFLLPAAGFNFLAAAGYVWLVAPMPDFQEGVRMVLAVMVPVAAVVLGIGIFWGRRTARRPGGAPDDAGDVAMQ